MFLDKQSLEIFLQKIFPDTSGRIAGIGMEKCENSDEKNVLIFIHEVTEKEKEQIKGLLEHFPEINEVTFTQDNIFLTDLMILNKIKIYQPILYESLLDNLKSSRVEFEEKELRSMLDKLRRKKQLLCSKKDNSYQYNLTATGLSLLSQGNSDIKRLFELKKKEW